MRLLNVAWEAPLAYGGLGTFTARFLENMPLSVNVTHIYLMGSSSTYRAVQYRPNVVLHRVGDVVVTKDSGIGVGASVVLADACLRLYPLFDAVLGHDVHASLCITVLKEMGVQRLGLFIHYPSGLGVEADGVHNAKVVYVNSRKVAEAVSMYDAKPLRIVYQPPPYPPVQQPLVKNDVKTILVFTRNQPNKLPLGVFDVIRKAVEKLKAQGVEAQVVVAGRGVESYPTPPWVVNKGTVNEEEKKRLMSTSHILVYPSAFEPYGLVPLEAIALGTPAIVSDGAGVSEVLPREAVYSTPEELVEKIVKYLVDWEELWRIESTAPIMRKTWLDLIKEVLEPL